MANYSDGPPFNEKSSSNGDDAALERPFLQLSSDGGDKQRRSKK